MKNSLVVFVFFCAISVAGQSKHMLAGDRLTGVWQINDTVVADALKKCFRFYSDKTFGIDYSEYDDLTRIKVIHGHYSVKNGILELNVEYRVELTGGHIIAGSRGFQQEEFVLDATQVDTIRQKTEENFLAVYVLKRDKSNKPCVVKIGNNKYYKLSDDPDKHKMKH